MSIFTHKHLASVVGVVSLTTLICGCRTPADYRKGADSAAYDIVEETRERVIDSGPQATFNVEPPADALRRRLIETQNLPAYGASSLGTDALEPPPHWPTLPTPQINPITNTIAGIWAINGTIELSLLDALQIAARNSREYQTAKENVFRTALALDLERNAFRATVAGALDSELSRDASGSETVEGSSSSLATTASKTFQTGAAVSSQIAVDLVKLLTGDRDSAWGLSADATISIPLLRGSGRHITREPLTQAERNVVYALFTLEEFKRNLAVTVAEGFLGVMQANDQAYNAQRNHETLVTSTKRATSMAKAGRLPEIQVDQTHQDQLRAYDRSVNAQQSAAQALDKFKHSLGLPPDAEIVLLRKAFLELIRDAETRSKDADAILPDTQSIIVTALQNRLDMQTAEGRIKDAQRAIVVAADALRAEVSLLGSASFGNRRSLSSATQDDTTLKLSEGILSSLISIDLPFERTAERNAFRNRITDLERAVRAAQEKEDSIKLQVLNGCRNLTESRESIITQIEAVQLAERRQRSTDLLLQAGRAEMRDLLEAEESLLSVRNALTSAIVRYRLAELRLQRDVGILQVSDSGLLQECDFNTPLSATPPTDKPHTDNSGAQDHE